MSDLLFNGSFWFVVFFLGLALVEAVAAVQEWRRYRAACRRRREMEARLAKFWQELR